MKFHLIICILLGLFTTDAFAQGKLVDRRDQAEGWYVPIHGEVIANGRKAKNFEVVLYRDNLELGRLNSKRSGNFELELDIDQKYAVRIVKEGFQDKLICVDTRLPNDLVNYPDYICFVEMLPVNFQNVDPFYADFPSAMIKFDAEKGGFYHSETYLTHIQTKLAGYAKATN